MFWFPPTDIGLSGVQVGVEVAPHLKDSLNRNFFDLLATFRQIGGESVQNLLVVQRVEVPEYLTLYSPAINWILQCIAYRAPEVRIPPHWGSVSEQTRQNRLTFMFQILLTEMMDRCKTMANKYLQRFKMFY